MFTQITNHVQQALARLITQYFQATKFQSLITAFVQPMQTIENALVDMNTLRYLNNATGQQLDNIGQIVGLPRPAGLSDSAYALELLGQIKINISQGQPEQLIQVFALFTGVSQVRLFEMFPACVKLESSYYPPDQATANSLINVLLQTAPAGVRVAQIVCYDSVSPFAYRVNVVPGAGYGSVSTPGVGGKYATMYRQLFPFGYAGTNPNIRGYGTVKDPLVGGAYAS